MRYILFLIFSIGLLHAQTTDVKQNRAPVVLDSTRGSGKALTSGGSVTDSLANKNSVPDSTKKKAVVDTVRYQQHRPFYTDDNFLLDSTFLWRDYRYFADYFNATGLSFTRSLGTAVQPEEVTLYGLGNGMISAFEDGEYANNRSSGVFNFNELQGDAVEKVEMPGLARGFLYGPSNNPVTVNALSATGISAIPYTRIRYYQAPFLEGFFDFRQQQIFFKKLFFALQITNKKKDQGYAASAGSSWLASVQLLYPLTNKISIGANYRFVKFAPGLFGGVDMDSVGRIYSNKEKVLYDEILAPVATPNLYYKTFQNSFALTGRYKVNSEVFNEVSIYLRERVTMFRMNADDTVHSPNRLSMNQTVKTVGLRFRHDINSALLHISINEGMENSTGRDTLYAGIPTNNRWYVGGTVTFFPLSPVLISVFAKLSGNKEQTLPGIGGDLKIHLTRKMSLYAGASSFQRERSLQDLRKTTFLIGEGRVDYTASDKERYALSVYSYRSTESVGARQILTAVNNKIVVKDIVPEKIAAAGFAVNSLNTLGFIVVEGTFSGFLASSKTGKSAQIPLISGQVGIYYQNVHFDSSLNIKTGFNTRFYSQYTPLAYDLFYQTTYLKEGTAAIPGNADLAFFMAAEVKKRAIVYFTWENLLDREYYVTAYFPMPRRGLRFGIAWQLFN